MRNKRRQTAEAPALDVVVAPGRQAAGIAPEAASGIAAAASVHERPWWRRLDWTRLLGGIALAIALALLARRLLPRVQRWRAARALHAQQRLVGEPAMFAAVESACRRQDAKACYAALLAWSRTHLPGGLAAWRDDRRNPGLDAALRALEARLYGGADDGHWDAAALQKSLAAARAAWLAGHAGRHRHHSLPALNGSS